MDTTSARMRDAAAPITDQKTPPAMRLPKGDALIRSKPERTNGGKRSDSAEENEGMSERTMRCGEIETRIVRRKIAKASGEDQSIGFVD